MKAFLKTIFLFLAITLCILILLPVRLLFYFALQKRRRLTAIIVHWFSKIFVFILGIKITISGAAALLKKRGVFFVCNHLGYIDGIVANAVAPLVFIGKADMRKWPFFGIFSFLADTIFVNRSNPSGVKKEIERMVSFLKSSVNVILFPEGTSTDGSQLLPFKSSFFAAAQTAQASIIPLVIAYKKINGQPVTDKNRDLLCWYGTMPFLPHLLQLLKLSTIDVQLSVCDMLLFEQTRTMPRKNLRDVCHGIIEEHFNAID